MISEEHGEYLLNIAKKAVKTYLETGEQILVPEDCPEELKEKLAHGGNIEAAKLVGEEIAKKAKVKGIECVVFDRGGFLYHGRVAALADAAREAGLMF